MQDNKTQFLLLILVIMGSVGLIDCNSYNEGWPTPSSTHSIQHMSGVGEIWSLKNVYTGQDSSPRMVASAGKVFILGNIGNNTEENIVCLDGLNGNVVWRKTNRGYEEPGYPLVGYPSVLFAAPDGLYVGYGGVPSVKKLALSTGDILWSQSLDGRGLWFLYAQEDSVQVSTDPFIHTVLDKITGEILQSTQDWRGGQDIYISAPDVTIMHPLQVVRTSTGELIWRQDLDRELTLAPIFLDHIILVRTNRTMGSIYALARASGAILWKTDGNIISGIAYSPSNAKVYVLTRDGKLLSIDRDSGNQVTLAVFSSVPFVLNGEQVVGGYEIAFDDTTEMLYVLLGDSRQLYAFMVE